MDSFRCYVGLMGTFWCLEYAEVSVIDSGSVLLAGSGRAYAEQPACDIAAVWTTLILRVDRVSDIAEIVDAVV